MNPSHIGTGMEMVLGIRRRGEIFRKKLLIESKKMEKGNEAGANRVFDALPQRALSGPQGSVMLVLHTPCVSKLMLSLIFLIMFNYLFYLKYLFKYIKLYVVFKFFY
jgi:hypothetical protein